MLNALNYRISLKIKILLIICAGTLLIQMTNAQWQTELRLTNDPAISYTSNNNAWCVAATGDTVHVVWYDQRDGNYEIYYKRSTNGGVSWGADTRLTNNSAFSGYPSVAVSGSSVHVVWHDFRDVDQEIYYKRSTDGGLSWGTDTRLTNNVGISILSSISVSGSSVNIVWYDNRDGNQEIYYKRSTDGGVSFGADNRLTNNSANSYLPSVSVSGQVVHVIWDDDRDGNDETYYKRSTDGGVTFGSDTRLTNNSALSVYPSVTVSGLVVHVVWNDNRDGNLEVYYKRSTDAGVSWGADTRLTNDPALSYYPSVAVSGSAVHVVWYDFRDGNNEIYYKRDPTGNPVGIININSEIPKQYYLSQNYPNPFNPSTKIKFAVPLNEGGDRGLSVKLTIFDVVGREVTTLVNQLLQPGTYEVDFDGSKYASGVYYYKLSSDLFTETKGMVFIK